MSSKVKDELCSWFIVGVFIAGWLQLADWLLIGLLELELGGLAWLLIFFSAPIVFHLLIDCAVRYYGPNEQHELRSEELKRDSLRRAYGRPCRVILKGGETVTVDRFEMVRTYLGLIEGIPPRNHIESRMRQAENYIRDHWKRPRIVTIPPDITGAGTDRPVLPTLTMMAQITCQEPRNGNEDGSWLNLVWFADIDDQKSIKDFVGDALVNLDWQQEAEGYVI